MSLLNPIEAPVQLQNKDAGGRDNYEEGFVKILFKRLLNPNLKKEERGRGEE